MSGLQGSGCALVGKNLCCCFGNELISGEHSPFSVLWPAGAVVSPTAGAVLSGAVK